MPGINGPVNEQVYRRILDLENQVRGMATQQQYTFTNADGEPIITLGLVPGSSPAAYGLQLLDPSTGKQLLFMGDDASGAGRMVLSSETGVAVMWAGTEAIPDGSGRTQQVFQLYRDDGTVALDLADNGTVPNHPHQQALAWYDRAGNVVLADDTLSGVGLANPHLQGPTLTNTNLATWPATSATTWTQIADGYMEHQNPQVTWQFQTYAPAGATGQFQMQINGTQVGATYELAGGTAGQFGTWSDQQPWPSGIAFGDVANLAVQAQVSAGTGTISCRQQYLSGAQS